MKKNGYLRRFLALFLALVMIMADSSVTTFAATVGRVRQQNATQKVTPTPGNSNTYRDVLGGAVNYGIVTTRLILGGHIDTNFAAGSLEPDTFADAITTGKYTGENNPGNIIIGDIPNHKYGFWAYSSTKKPFIITTTAEALQYIKKERDYVIYDVDHTKEELQQRVEKLRTGTMSAALADESRYTYYTLSSLLNGDQLDLRSYADGTYYIKVDNSAIISQAEGLKIQLNDKQNIVFYVPDNDVAINKFKINEMFSDRNDLSADPYAKRIIWNIPNATHVKIDNTFGVFLCPNADVDLGGTSSGWVVSKSFHNGGEWHNVWSEQPESIITKTNFCVEKKLAGANIANYAGKFNFVLMDEAGKKIQTKSNDGNGNVVFDDIQFDTAGTYTYYITEKNEQLANIGYDTGKVKVTVVVKTYTNQGNRKVTTIESVVYEKLDKDNNKIEESNVFKNSYNEAASGSLSLEGSKLLTGAALTDGMFEFQLSGDAERTVKNAGTKVDFGTIASWTGTDAKEFTFEVSEVNDGKAGYTYDGKTYKVKVKATYSAETNTYSYTLEKGTTEGVTISGGKISLPDKSFQNSFEAASGSLSLEGSKSLTGTELKDNMFEFRLSGDAEKTVKNVGTKVDFGTIASWTGTDAKEFTFEVSEVNDGKAGYTYDGKTYKVKVKATYSAETNTYSYSIMNGTTEGVTISKIGVISLPNASFVNEYNATGETTLTATKTLSGREFQAGDNWKFTVTCNDANAPLPENPVVTTTATSGTSTTLDFGKIHYTIADVNKDYVYTITESGNVANVTNDPVAARTVTVSVRDKGDGTLNVTQEVTGAGLIFTNKYVDGETTLSVTKVLSGREFKSGDEWTFKLTADEGAPMPAQTVVKTDATSGNSQSLSFGTIKYTLADVGNTYTYTIQETGSAEGVTNDPNATRTVTITVNEGKDGKLDIVREEPKGEIVFTNTYDAKGSLTLEASKTLKNKALEADAFNFVLKDENGETIQTVANDANGNVTFRPLNYTLEDVGLHTYTVSEVQKADAEVTYDTTVYTVEVTVADTGDGTLNVSKTIKKGSDTPGTMTFENIYKGVIEISGTKNWADENNQDGIRPTSITVNLFANGTKVADQKVTPDANGNWSYVFRNLPQYDVNGEITYTVTEDAVAGYETSVSGYNITNTHKPATTDITGTKTWNDSDNQDGKRPESITVNLLADGKITATKTVTAADNWTYSFTDLPKYANGEEITYTVSEDTVADYTTTYDGSNITNSYTPGKTSATVTKIWNDAENQDGKRPESITVSLLADGKETGKTVTLSVENNWKQTISDLPEKADGKAIEYTWTEETLPEGYELTDNSKNGTVTTLTNTYAPETTSISGTKTWDDADNQDGKRPESIIVNLLANGEIAASQTVKADEAGNWTYTFKDLPKYANGKEITYTVTEEAVEGYETSVDGFNITNTYTTETTEVKGSKTWNDADNQDGKRPESITVRLLANGEEKDSQTVTADENGNWTYSFEKLPKYEAGKEIVYTVTEDAVADYTTEITGYDITNSYAPGKTSVTVTKAWADNDNRGGHRPKEIKVQLKADGENSGEEITLNAENKWTYTWSELDEKKAGKDIVYTVEEIGKTAGYISTVTGNATEGFIITNTITSVKISKVDITDQKELAGAHIQILDKDGNVVDEWDSTWESHEVTGLKTGEKYTLRETVAPDGYTITADTVFSLKEDGTLDKDNTSTTISADGTLLVEDSRTSVKVSKVDISDGKELEGAHIQIIDQDGNVVDEWDSTKEAHVTEKLKTGKIYTLRETVAPDGYLLTSDTTFVLKEDGTVDAEKTTAVSKDGVLLVQDKLATSASIAVTKKLTYIGESLAARDQTFYVALYSDKECTQRVSDVKALVFKNADASTVVFSENIKAGKTYYIAECTQDGTSQTIGALADGTVYEAVFGNGNSTTVTEANGTTTVSFENVFSSFPPDGFYKQGQLTITKKVLGADGGTRNSNEVFYAGIFDDAAHTQLSQQVEQNIIKLDMDGGYEVSETINVGLAQSGAKVTLYVTETDSNGKPIAGSEGFGYKVTVSADSVTLDETNMTAEVVITNQEESTVTETPTPTPSSDGGNSGGSENHSGGYGGGKSPKTGDDTPIGTYLMLLLAAAMLAAETERRRRRNKRQ